jgi:hypothetical protein
VNEKIKKYYKDHEVEIMVGLALVSGTVLAYAVGYKMAAQYRVVQADIMTTADDEQYVYVHYKNGGGEVFGNPLDDGTAIPIPGITMEVA